MCVWVTTLTKLTVSVTVLKLENTEVKDFVGVVFIAIVDKESCEIIKRVKLVHVRVKIHTI